MLGRLGTEVKHKRTLETDVDIEPYQFVRGAVHEYIFPPQDIETKKVEPEVIDPTLDYNLVKRDVVHDYDETLVKGHLRLCYDDAESQISFQVGDVMGDSELDPEIVTCLESVRAFIEERTANNQDM